MAPSTIKMPASFKIAGKSSLIAGLYLLKAAVAFALYEDVEVAVIAIGSCGVADPRSHKSGRHFLTPNAAEIGTTAMAEATMVETAYFDNLFIRIFLS